MHNGTAAVFDPETRRFEVRSYPVAAPAAGCARLALLYSGICGTDLHICDGKLGPMPFPLILGHEFVGRIEALGAGDARDGLGQSLAVGDAVVSCVAVPCGSCTSCRRGETASCLAFGVTYVRPAAEPPHFHGGFAEYQIAGFRRLVRIPDGLGAKAVAAFPCGGPTILRACAYAGGLSKDELVVVQGNGPLGLFAIAYARAVGCRTVCIGSAADARRTSVTAEFAPDLFLDYRSTSPEEAVERVRVEAGRLGRGDGADVCIETSGNPAAFPLGLRLLRTRGRYIVPGQYSNRGDVSIPPHDITFRALRVIGSGQYTLGDIGAYLRFLTEHPALQPTFAATVACYAVEDVSTAIADAAAGRAVKAAFARVRQDIAEGEPPGPAPRDVAADAPAAPITVDAERVEFISRYDGRRDWYLVVPGRPDAPCVVNLHGHGANGDQLWERADIRSNLDAAVQRGRTVIAPHLRGNAWMSPAATADLVQILTCERQRRSWTKTLFAGGSMGATSSLAFAAQHPELVDGVVALGAATDIARYEAWCRHPDAPPATAAVRAAIAAAIATSYGDADRAMHSACRNAARLTMPIVLVHGEDDTVIPVEEARVLAATLAGRDRFVYREIPGGNHDSPLRLWGESMDALERMVTP